LGGDKDQVIAALLHDSGEDQGGEPTGEIIRPLLGNHVASIIEECSDNDPEASERGPENSRIRKQKYVQHLPGKSHDALMVSLADKLYNAPSILFDLRQYGNALWNRFNVGRDDQL
jgi:(p)ppGpp synthase/HD superfamily hydrolase